MVERWYGQIRGWPWFVESGGMAKNDRWKSLALLWVCNALTPITFYFFFRFYLLIFYATG